MRWRAYTLRRNERPNDGAEEEGGGGGDGAGGAGGGGRAAAKCIHWCSHLFISSFEFLDFLRQVSRTRMPTGNHTTPTWTCDHHPALRQRCGSALTPQANLGTQFQRLRTNCERVRSFDRRKATISHAVQLAGRVCVSPPPQPPRPAMRPPSSAAAAH